MAFEYGYSVERPDALVCWEAQFGDFANGAQTVIDEFISSSEQKWGQRSSLVLLLPHGYEGQGPDHSSARIERFLILAAQRNMTIAQPSTPASYFHLLRRQAYARPRRPLVVFTPKSMLRLRGATSSVEDLTEGRFQPVIDDARIQDRSQVDRDRAARAARSTTTCSPRRRSANDLTTALVRVEQYYPVPQQELLEVVACYPEDAELVWAQDEPANQGAAPFVQLRDAAARPRAPGAARRLASRVGVAGGGSARSGTRRSRRT